MSLQRPELLSFLQAVKEAPEDSAPREILADWLKDNGDEERGTFVQLQCQVANLPWGSSERSELETRIDSLWCLHREEWLGRLVQLAPSRIEYTHGLLRLTCDAQRLQELAPEAQGWTEEWAWVEHLHLPNFSRVPKLLTDPVLEPITSLQVCFVCPLNFNRPQPSPAWIRLALTSAGSSSLRNLIHFSLADSRFDRLGFEALVESLDLPRLRSLDLSSCYLGPADARILAGASSLSRLKVLDLSFNQIRLEGVEVLCQSRNLQSLTRLYLGYNSLSDDAALVLARSALLQRLDYLALWSNPINDAARELLTQRFDKVVQF